MHSRYFPSEFRDLYKLHNKSNPDGYVYCVIQRGMYGIKQAAILAYQQLVQILKPFGYVPVEGTTGLSTHLTRPTKFVLFVDDFGVIFFSKEDAFHLINALKTKYEISQDWTGTNYCGLRIKWNYKKLFVDIREDPILPAKKIKLVQSKIGACLYYGRGVDPTILVALNELGTEQEKPTATTEKALTMLLDYLAIYPNVVIRFVAGTMQLKVELDASYLAVKDAKSRIAGHFYLESMKN